MTYRISFIIKLSTLFKFNYGKYTVEWILLLTINVQNYFQLISNYTIQMQKEKTLTQILV